ncbi:MAG: hypothetical protein Tsb006_0920 [Rickettsiaceae bacterium]
MRIFYTKPYADKLIEVRRNDIVVGFGEMAPTTNWSYTTSKILFNEENYMKNNQPITNLFTTLLSYAGAPWAKMRLSWAQLLLLCLLTALSASNCAFADSQKIKGLELELRYAVAGNKWEQMIVAADELLKHKPKHPDAHFEKAEALKKFRRYQEAIDLYDLAIKYKYRYLGYLYYQRGQCLEQLNKLEEALESYDLAIKHGLKDRWVLFAQNGVLMKLGRLGNDPE